MSSARLSAKAEEIPPVFFRIKPEVHARLEFVLKRHSGGRNDLARDGLLREIERLEQQAAPVTPKEAKSIETFKKVTGSKDICSVLAEAMRDHVSRSAALPVFATSVAGSAPGAAKPAGAELGTDTGRRALRNGASSKLTSAP